MVKRHLTGLAALCLGVTAIVLAVLGESEARAREQRRLAEALRPGWTVKIRGVSITVGGKPRSETTAEPRSAPTGPPRLQLAALTAAALAFFLGPFSWVREKQPILSCSAIGFAAVAVAWQYIVAGIVVGVAVVVIALLLSHFS